MCLNRIRIAYAGGKRWRVVTLNGEMVEQSGAMSGGGNSVFRGLMGAKMAKDGAYFLNCTMDVRPIANGPYLN